MKYIALCCGLIAASSLGTAQEPVSIPVPIVELTGRAVASLPLSAQEAAYHVIVQDIRARSSVSFLREQYPADSVHAVVAQAATHWLTQLAGQPVHGLQLDPDGYVNVIANREAVARQQIAGRLATPGLSLLDRAYTYLTAILAFTNGDAEYAAAHADRLVTAERYCAALDSLGPGAALQRFRAHRALSGVYYLAGRSNDVLRHGLRAVALISQIEFDDRRAMYWDPQFYSELVDAMASQPHARARIEALNATLTAGTVPAPAVLARDPAYAGMSQQFAGSLRETMIVGTRVGTSAQDVVGNFWVNLTAPKAIAGDHTMSMSDGTIHVLEMGHYTCGQCIEALGTLQRLHDHFQAIRVVYATATEGSWANRLVEPSVEAQQLAVFYTDKLKVTFPISIWNGPLRPTDDGGMLPENSGPNFEHYPMAFKPNIYIIDGRGIIRRVLVGTITRDREVQMARLIAFLMREHAPDTATPSSGLAQ